MAIPYFQVNAQSRRKGASAIAKAAYNTGSNLRELDGRLHSYDRKSDVKFSRLIFSQKINEPYESRENFWQTVEQSEKRKDACVSREFVSALPRELSYEQNLKLAQEFTQIIIERYDLRAADLAIHYPTKRKPWADLQHENPHLHLLIPDRNIQGEKNRAMNHNRSEIFALRDLWEQLVNSHLSNAGFNIQISLKSNEIQINILNAELKELDRREQELILELKKVKEEISNYYI